MTPKSEKRNEFSPAPPVGSLATGPQNDPLNSSLSRSLNDSVNGSAKLLALIILAIVALIGAGYYAAPRLLVALRSRLPAPTRSLDRLTPITALQLPSIIAQALESSELNSKPPKAHTANLEKIAVVNIWATWCPPCRAEMPEFVKFRNRQIHGEVAVILVSADDENTKGEVLSFLKSLNIDFDSFIVGEPAPTFVRQLSANWAGGLPATFILNQKGEVLQEFVGTSTAASLSKLVSEWQSRLAVPH